MPRAPRTPAYRLHKASGQAVVTLNGLDFYLGRHGSPESRAEYDRLMAEWLASGRLIARDADGQAPKDLTVSELILAYLTWADGYYVKNGTPTSEPVNIRLAMRPLRKLYGHTSASRFGPLALKTVREAMVESGLCRNEVNKRTRHVVRAFKWAVGEELVPPSVHHGLKAVSGLKRGRSEARETEPVRPVPEAHVDAVLPHVVPQVRAMIELQRLTGMRPGEVIVMRTGDLVMTGPVWEYRPRGHKTEHHGHERVVYLGPRAQAVLRPWLRADPTASLFQPREAMEDHLQERREGRKTPMTPSQAKRRRKPQRQRPPGERYQTSSYHHAIKAGIRKANRLATEAGQAPIPSWHPHQLRHNAATAIRREFDAETARVILGHRNLSVTEIYAEADRDKAAAAMGRVG